MNQPGSTADSRDTAIDRIWGGGRGGIGAERGRERTEGAGEEGEKREKKGEGGIGWEKEGKKEKGIGEWGRKGERGGRG